MKLAEIKVSYSTVLEDKIKITGSDQIYSIALEHWDMNTIEFQEEAKMILLNRDNSILSNYSLSKGGLANTTLDIKIVLSVALKSHSSSIVYNTPQNSDHGLS